MPPLFFLTNSNYLGVCLPRATARLRRDAEQHARSVKETLEAEYAEKIASTVDQSEEAEARASAAEKKATRLGMFSLCTCDHLSDCY